MHMYSPSSLVPTPHFFLLVVISVAHKSLHVRNKHETAITTYKSITLSQRNVVAETKAIVENETVAIITTWYKST